ncbi:acetyl-CoA synthetase-like protein [Hymenopellis radicata]|nr:acetyl-CoA synthetase-like protein [Hymenopellis radicata]
MVQTPHRSLTETDAILCGPGCPHEMETRLVDGRLLRVYKNLPSSLRAFWLWAVSKYHERVYIVFENERLTYGQVHQQATRLAAIFYSAYGVRKGDRIGICSRNCSEYLINFWASHLLGAVPVLVNAWLPTDPLKYCLVHTQCKLLIVDHERAVKLEPILPSIYTENDLSGGTESYHDVLEHYSGEVQSVLAESYPYIHPEDNAAIMFTSGTTGLPKGVLSTQRQFLTNVLNTIVGGKRAAIRRGDDPSSGPSSIQKGALVAVPLFHVTGTTSYSMMATMNGMKIVLMRKWIPEEGANLIRRENVCVAGGVPAMVSDLMDSSLAGFPLEGLFFGGCAAPDVLAARAKQVFPKAQLSQGYGLTETNSISVTNAGEDYELRPNSTGRACPVNDVLIMAGDTCLSPGRVGEVWIRGPNVMKGYWRDPEATHKILTADGWLKTGDIGVLDEEGFLYIKDRIKDIIIRGGENVSSVTVENALHTDPRVLEAAAVGVPDKRLGELVTAVVSIKPAYRGQVTESSLMLMARELLPRFAVPVMIVIRDEPFELTPSGKIIKAEIRQIARFHWEQRQFAGLRSQPTANL